MFTSCVANVFSHTPGAVRIYSSDLKMSSQRASLLGLYALLAIFDLEPLDLQITAAPRSQVILAEHAS
ncbi:hypothetical protein SAMN04488244_13724 [Vibrio hangzhouensis]|uniref:Uncharacterized protein n=1 Tax=Vibrio hangzhouensis TaxID=462991 RepID=A0A1H6CF38_9VIBR|nr:hypothetical protein SAMN04488244_1031 [Vibrio hangzhouensis]SEG71433.1 hypothetical protein SAMN04488244_13724 [Vibrio hangzhouensis]